jgi:uncharacterized DUF497 family protein
LPVLEDSRHGGPESRFHPPGKTDDRRLLHFSFTVRHPGEKIRAISAREMHRKERVIYEKAG